MWKLLAVVVIGLAISNITAHENVANRDQIEHHKNREHSEHFKNKNHGSVDHFKSKNHAHAKNLKADHHGHLAHEAKTHHTAHNSKHFSLNHLGYNSKHHFQNRDDSDDNSTSSDNSLDVCYDPHSSTQIIYNQPNCSGSALNFSAQIAIIFNDETRQAIGFNLIAQIGVKIINSNTSSWEQILSQTSSLEHFIQIGQENGTSFNLSSIPDDVNESIGNILKNLSSDYSQISDFLTDFRSLIKLFDQTPNIFAGFQTQIRNGFRSFVQRLVGLSSFLNNFSNQTELRNVTLNPTEILNPETGLNAFISVIQQLMQFFNPLNYLGLNFTQNFLSLADGFGCTCNPFDRFLHIINQIVQILSGNNLDTNFISSLIQLFGNSMNFPNLLNQWRDSFENLLGILRNSSNSSSGLEELQNLVNQTGFINGFNISNIFNIFQDINSSSPIDTIVKLLVSLSRNLSPQFSIPNLLGQLVGLYRNSTNGNNSILQNLFPNLNNLIRDNNSNDLVSQFLSLFQNGAQLFIGIPLQVFLLPISQALGRCSNGNLSLISVMQGPESLANFANPAGFANLLANAANNFAQLAASAAHGFGNLINVPAQIFTQGLGNGLMQNLNPADNNKSTNEEKHFLKHEKTKSKHEIFKKHIKKNDKKEKP